MKKYMNKIGLYSITLLPVAGEFGRIAFGPGNGALISDLAIAALIILWAGQEYLRAPAKKQKSEKNKIQLPLLIFIAIAALSLVRSLLFLSPPEVMDASLYLIRYAMYAMLFFITFQTIQKEEKGVATTLIKCITISALLIAILGFIQLAVYPNLTELEEIGWDPHINRLVSTWLDPNFTGGLLAFIITILLGIFVHEQKIQNKSILLAASGILGIALFLTYSRSAWLACAVGITIVTLLKSRKLLIIIVGLALLGLTISPRAQQRVGELTQSLTSIIWETSDTPDPTTKLRIQSYQNTLSLIAKRPLLGSGYNTLRTVNHQEGFVSGQDIHSAGGADSSFLTILATTGIMGLIPFLLLYLTILKLAWQNARNKKIPPFFQGYNLGLLAALVGLVVHSTFVNSLLYPHILIYFWITIGIAQASRNFKKN